VYLCLCNNVRESDIEKYHLIGKNCGICLKNAQKPILKAIKNNRERDIRERQRDKNGDKLGQMSGH
tara:strand:+ start:330 stop:527 length:198 start_codon:yes stop_codon:yes gene_type:complete